MTMTTQHNKQKYRIKSDIKSTKKKVMTIANELFDKPDVKVELAIELELAARNLVQLQSLLNSLEKDDTERAVKRMAKAIESKRDK